MIDYVVFCLKLVKESLYKIQLFSGYLSFFLSSSDRLHLLLSGRQVQNYE